MIYILEDDNSIRELVTYSLGSTGYEAHGFEKPSDFWAAIEKKVPDLLLLDIMLPEEDGLSVLKKLRSCRAYRKLPVILLTAKSCEYDKVIGLDQGADDYIAKPFGMMELIARVKALIRRTKPDDENKKEYRIKDLFVSPSRHVVRIGEKEVTLTFKEFELLCLFFENADIVLTRDQLLNKIWGYSFDGESRTVDVHIRSLRQKLGDYGEYIETVRGIGYKLSVKE
ncbi:MAG: response regulator transcription factor [Oscillospiraceae bacterium]|nr:response regulator transcription factor [Oscillospiraceae bacterium]